MDSRITKEDIEKMIEELRLNTPCPSITDMWRGTFYPTTLACPPVVESKYVQDLEPVIQLSEVLDVSPEFRKKVNDWYIDMFGYKEPVIWKTQFGYIMGKNTRGLIFGDCTA